MDHNRPDKPARWRPMTYAELILDQRSHDMERGNDGIVHARSCWCAVVPGDDEPEIPNNPYPPGDPRGWTRFKDCPSHFCAAQRQHMPSCPQADVPRVHP